MNVDLEIATLFPSTFSRVKKGGNFRTNIPLDSVESFLHYLSSKLLVLFYNLLTWNMFPGKETEIIAFKID